MKKIINNIIPITFVIVILIIGIYQREDLSIDYFVAPGESINDAIQAASAGDTIHVQEGIYHEVVRLNKDEITVVCHDAVIDGRYVLPIGSVVRTDPISGNWFVYAGLVDFTADNVTMDGCTITRSLGRSVRFFDGASGNVLRNTIISHGRSNGILIHWGDQGNTDNIIENVEVFDTLNFATYSRSAHDLDWGAAIINQGHRTHISQCKVYENWGEGIIAGRGSNGTIIDGCDVYNNYALQIYTNHAWDVKILNNTVWFDDPRFYRGGKPSGGIILNNEGNYSGHDSRNILIEGNTVTGCGQNFGTWGHNRPQTDIMIRGNTSIEAFDVAFFVSNGNHVNFQINDNVIFQQDESKIWNVPSVVSRSGNVINPVNGTPTPSPTSTSTLPPTPTMTPTPEHSHQDIYDRFDAIESQQAQTSEQLTDLEQRISTLETLVRQISDLIRTILGE